MLNLHEIHKPTTLEEACKLLQQPDTVPMAGGTALIAGTRRDVRAVVDLSALGLSYVRENEGAIVIGATTTLADLVESPILRAYANGTLALAAKKTTTSVLRNQSTIAGTLLSEPNGVLAVALLALDARVSVLRKQVQTVSFADFLSMREHLLMMALLTEVSFPMSNPRAALQTVARTPSDKAIVSACAAAQRDNGILKDVRIAVGGEGEIAVRARDMEKALEGQAATGELVARAAALASAGLTPVGDFRGSVEYRKEMAVVLTRRAVEEINSTLP